ncbi:hypothetical protein H5410_063998 [Solanum commersonii]|uniref:Uncharacterized protein n=1 Tax=Solanum commersonii TaxID=4109 RepID=A0A9J5W0M3_SOLCO|nr:hypothetical protein H5410_063998 [Solanum commersonii]
MRNELRRHEKPRIGAALLNNFLMRPQNIQFNTWEQTSWGGEGRGRIGRQRAESRWMRGSKATLPLTIPVAYLSRLQRILPADGNCTSKAVTAALPSRRLNQRPRALGAKGPYCGSASGRRAHASLLAGFDLEALSHNPAHGNQRQRLFNQAR